MLPCVNSLLGHAVIDLVDLVVDEACMRLNLRVTSWSEAGERLRSRVTSWSGKTCTAGTDSAHRRVCPGGSFGCGTRVDVRSSGLANIAGTRLRWGKGERIGSALSVLCQVGENRQDVTEMVTSFFGHHESTSRRQRPPPDIQSAHASQRTSTESDDAEQEGSGT